VPPAGPNGHPLRARVVTHSAHLLFEEGGVLTPTSVTINDQLPFSLADTGRDHREPKCVTCTYSFTTEEGTFNFVVTGISNVR
jgi:hypothetical protein